MLKDKYINEPNLKSNMTSYNNELTYQWYLLLIAGQMLVACVLILSQSLGTLLFT
jgi:hypothetical protein